MIPPTPVLKTVYTPEQFASEILNGNRHVNWVRNRCRTRQIATVARRPYLIPQSEALKFINPAVR